VRDYQRFLGAVETVVAPYFGGPFVEAADRRLRLTSALEPLAPGFWRFEVRGRSAHAIEPAEPPDLSGLPAVRGYALDAYLVRAGGLAERFALGPPDEPPMFAPLVGRRWPPDALLFEGYDFETGVEDPVREAFEARRPIGDVPGVPAPLRAAFGYAILLRAARETGIPARPAEARGWLRVLADEADLGARRLLGHARQRRDQERSALPVFAPRERADGNRLRSEERAAAALHAANAGLRGLRWLEGNRLEVRYDYLGDRFVSIVEGGSLRVVDAGICLDGRDDELTLESLPAVIREAVQSGRLHVTIW
jgi:hypothetical protein